MYYCGDSPSINEENIVLIEGRLSIKDDSAIIIANSIKDFEIEKTTTILLDITNMDENNKERLKATIKYFSGTKENAYVQVKVNEETRECGKIYLNDEILNIFKEIALEENVEVIIEE